MSKQKVEPSPSSRTPLHEDQSQRRVKYGANVVLVSVMVIALAAFAVWLAQSQDLHLFGKRFSLRARPDLTSNSSNTLKPQTVAIVQDLPKKVTLVCLYPKLKEEEKGQKEDTRERVLNILDQYRQRNPDKVTVEAIDPIAEPARLDAWIGQIKRDYGQNISSYEELLRGFPKTLEQIKQLSSSQSLAMRQMMQSGGEDAVGKLPEKQQEKLANTINGAFSTVQQFPAILQLIDTKIKEELEKKIPDYEAGKTTLVSLMGQFSEQDQLVSQGLAQLRDDKTAPQILRAYATSAVKVFDQMKKIADDTVNKAKALGKLKLEDVRRKLIPADDTESPPPAIVVMGPEDIRVIDFDSVWKSGDSTGLMGASGQKARLRFAGEQQITSALLALSQGKRKVVAFVRGGGPPVTDARFRGPLTDIADRLRSYNFEVVEKDLSGQWARQMMQQRQMMPTPEPSDEELKDAVWIVTSNPPDMQSGMPSGPLLTQRLKDHLEPKGKGAAPGAAMVLIALHGDPMSSLLSDYGLEARPELLCVHEAINSAAGTNEDFVERARRQPPIFVINQYGDSPVTTPLASLDAALVPLLPIRKRPSVPSDVKLDMILPVPQEPKSWGESDLRFVEGDPNAPQPTFDAGSGDLAGPLFGGAVAEKKGAGKLVVFGGNQWMFNPILEIPDPKMEKQRLNVARFPGNGELFANSVFWLAGEDKMIALSPSAMDTPRIAAMGPGALNFWRLGIFIIGLPLAALLCGLFVYQTRRD
ncbi:MAG TPA: Gldg family protein [Tepidisphaeraceae bacterium]|nr:Gldg family protein [Tepidisphaeraceae bacterium]